jgi:light-regulated signal transduction histidine kinase (bacteriophytochrome)
MEYTLLSMLPDAPPEFAYRAELRPADVRRQVFALYAASVEAAELALQNYRGKVYGIVVTKTERFTWKSLGQGLYHLGIQLESPWLEMLQPMLHLVNSEQMLSNQVAGCARELLRAEEDRGRLVREFESYRSSLQAELTDRKRAEEEVRTLNCELEQRVLERTAELHDTNERLLRSNAELEQFAYAASHDLQEPLRMVSSYTQLLARRYQGKLDADADEFIGFAVDGAKRMQQLIVDMLSYSRLTTQARPLVSTDCNQLLKNVLDNLTIAIRESGTEIRGENLPTIKVDATQISQLLQNLIANAIKFRKHNAAVHIDISAVREDTFWHFRVQDNGIGIDPQYQERIFILFQRLHTREEYPGTGIGLAVCKKIIQRHGGNIWVESAAGQGATFHFTIPV